MADVGMVGDDVAARREVADRMAEAAHAWLETLDGEQRGIGQGRPGRRRQRTTNAVAGSTPRPTTAASPSISSDPRSSEAAMRLVSTGLSAAAYVTVATIMGLENVLDHIEGFVVRFDRERGRDPGMYYLRVFGEPGQQTSVGLAVWWTPRVVEQPRGGRRARRDDAVLPGVDPATSLLLGGAVNRPLARVEDLARDLMRSLQPDLADRALLVANAPSDLITANRTYVTDGDRLLPLAGIWGTIGSPIRWSRQSCRLSATPSTRPG